MPSKLRFDDGNLVMRITPGGTIDSPTEVQDVILSATKDNQMIFVALVPCVENYVQYEYLLVFSGCSMKNNSFSVNEIVCI